MKGRKGTLDRIGLGQLGEVHDEIFREGVPCLAFLHAEVDMRTGEFIRVELRRPNIVSTVALFSLSYSWSSHPI